MKSSVHAMTWDGKNRIMLDSTYIDKMVKEILLFGPLAAMYGKEIEQILMQNHMPDLVSEADFAFSVHQGRTGRTAVKKVPLRAPSVDESNEEDVRRARTPSRRGDVRQRGRDSSRH